MARESKSWRPAHWSETKRHRFTDDVFRFMEWNLEQFQGTYNGAKLAAELRAQRRAVVSLAMLKQRGVRTAGEVQS